MTINVGFFPHILSVRIFFIHPFIIEGKDKEKR